MPTHICEIFKFHFAPIDYKKFKDHNRNQNYLKKNIIIQKIEKHLRFRNIIQCYSKLKTSAFQHKYFYRRQ